MGDKNNRFKQRCKGAKNLQYRQAYRRNRKKVKIALKKEDYEGAMDGVWESAGYYD